MKFIIAAIVVSFSLLGTSRLNAQSAANSERCIQKTTSSGVMILTNTCSQVVLLQVFDNSIGIDDGVLSKGQHLNVVTDSSQYYKWFACPANTTAVKTGTDEEVDAETRSYECADLN